MSKGDHQFHSKSSLAFAESLSMPLVQEIVLSADIRCTDCQERVADILSKMNETYSVLVGVLEKKVTLTCIYSGGAKENIRHKRQLTAICKTPFTSLSISAIIKRMFCC